MGADSNRRYMEPAHHSTPELPTLVCTLFCAVIEVIGMLDFRSFLLKSFPIKSACVPSIFSRHRLS